MTESELKIEGLKIDEGASDGMSVAPDPADQQDDAGNEPSADDRSSDNLDRGLDESMDASDTPSAVQPGGGTDPSPSSGYDEEAEAGRQRDA